MYYVFGSIIRGQLVAQACNPGHGRRLLLFVLSGAESSKLLRAFLPAVRPSIPAVLCIMCYVLCIMYYVCNPINPKGNPINP